MKKHLFALAAAAVIGLGGCTEERDVGVHTSPADATVPPPFSGVPGAAMEMPAEETHGGPGGMGSPGSLTPAAIQDTAEGAAGAPATGRAGDPASPPAEPIVEEAADEAPPGNEPQRTATTGSTR